MREVTATVMTGFDGGNAADFRIHPGREAALMHHHPCVPTKPGVPSHPTASRLPQTLGAEPLRQQPQVWFGGPFSACSKEVDVRAASLGLPTPPEPCPLAEGSGCSCPLSPSLPSLASLRAKSVLLTGPRVNRDPCHLSISW